MAAKQKPPIKHPQGSTRKAAALWVAVSVALLATNALMLGSILGKDHKGAALEASKRLEFDLTYDDQGNAQPENLKGEPLDLATAEAMAALAVSTHKHGNTPEEGVPAEETGLAPPPAPEPAPETETPEPAPAPGEAHPAVAPESEPEAATGNETTGQPAATPAPAAPAAPPPAALQQENTQAAPVQSVGEAPAPAPTPPAVVLAPVEAQTEHGILPVIAPDGTKPWQYFAQKGYTATAKPKIAVIVTGLGLSAADTEQAIALPAAVTLAFSPYGRDGVASMMEKAKATGHETLLDLPLQTDRFPAVDPGPYGIRNDLSAEENTARLNTVLGKARGYVGLIGTAKDSVSADEKAIVPLLDAIAGRGLLFVAGHEQVPPGMFRVQRKATVPMLTTDILLDERLTETDIKNQMARAEDRARNTGRAVVLAHPYPVTAKLLEAWLKTLEGKNFALIPISAASNK